MIQLRFSLGVVLVLLAAGIVSGQDAKLKPKHGTILCKNGMACIHAIPVKLGGPIATKKAGVKAWVAKAPHLQLVVQGFEDGDEPSLTISVEDHPDAALLMLLPNGKWLANAKQGNPLLDIKALPPGRYFIWVGSTERVPPAAQAKLRINDHSAD